MATTVNPEFGTIRSYLWPIHRYEYRKIIPMLMLLFLICFNYTVLRNLKDAVVVTASGAEVIPFIKVWVMLPMAVLLTYIFTKLSSRMSMEYVFYIVISGFLLSYALFAFVLYPLKEILHPHASADALQAYLPAGFKGLIAMYRNWTFTLFYVMCELWSTMVLTVLFWGFANQVTQIQESHRFYSVFSVCMNIATIAAGEISIFFSKAELPQGSDIWGHTVSSLVLLIIGSGILTMIIFRWINHHMFTQDMLHGNTPLEERAKMKKTRLSLRESIAYVSKSKYLLCIAIIVIAYNLVINLVEVVWKDQLRSLYPNSNDYNIYMNYLTSATALISTVAAFFLPKLLGRFGWTFTAMVTPFIMLVTSIGFFSFIFFREFMGPVVIALTGATPLAIAVFFGAAQNCCSKGAKYSVFDATKEMSYIPLSHECKIRGKAAIDGVGSRLGKSGGSFIHQGLLMVFGSLSVSAPYVAAILMGVILLWLVAVKSLGIQFNALVQEKEEEEEEVVSSVNDGPALSAV